MPSKAPHRELWGRNSALPTQGLILKRLRHYWKQKTPNGVQPCPIQIGSAGPYSGRIDLPCLTGRHQKSLVHTQPVELVVYWRVSAPWSLVSRGAFSFCGRAVILLTIPVPRVPLTHLPSATTVSHGEEPVGSRTQTNRWHIQSCWPESVPSPPHPSNAEPLTRRWVAFPCIPNRVTT